MTTGTSRPSRSIFLLFVAGPVIWITHFMAVYLLAEAVCAGDGRDRDIFGVSFVSLTTLAATAAAIVLTLYTSIRAYALWRSATGSGDWLEITDSNDGLAFAGFLLGLVSIAAIAFVGIPAAFLEPC